MRHCLRCGAPVAAVGADQTAPGLVPRSSAPVSHPSPSELTDDAFYASLFGKEIHHG